MQLENALAATPDPEIKRYFSLDKQNPASLQMVLEPLLLFDTVFIEDRPLIELISPEFSYQSDFLTDWYTTPLRAPPVDEVRIVEDNRVRNEKLKLLQSSIAAVREELDVLDRARADPIAEKLITVDLSAGKLSRQRSLPLTSPFHRGTELVRLVPTALIRRTRKHSLMNRMST